MGRIRALVVAGNGLSGAQRERRGQRGRQKPPTNEITATCSPHVLICGENRSSAISACCGVRVEIDGDTRVSTCPSCGSQMDRDLCGSLSIAIIAFAIVFDLDRPAQYSRFGFAYQPANRVFEPATASAFMTDRHIVPLAAVPAKGVAEADDDMGVGAPKLAVGSKRRYGGDGGGGGGGQTRAAKRARGEDDE